ELRTSQIEEPALPACRPSIRVIFEFDPAVRHGRKIVIGRPVARRELLTERDQSGLERFEGGSAVAIIFVTYAVEVEASDHDRTFGGPMVVDPIELDE